MGDGVKRASSARADADTTPPRMAYVARIKECGCVVAASVDEPAYASDTAKFVAREIREGFNVDRVTVGEARALPWGWPCEHMKATEAASQAQLAIETTS